MPLRNDKTASKSDIFNFNYPSYEIKLLLYKPKLSLETLGLLIETSSRCQDTASSMRHF